VFGLNTQCVLDDLEKTHHDLDDYTGEKPRWCPGCGDYAILTAVQKLCHEEQIPPEKTVFVSGVGCASQFPANMNTYGFQGLHGRALPVAEGVKMRRPDLNVFVNMGDGDCFSAGAGHWIHAIRYNMDMVAIVHDNRIYGFTKSQVSPTSPKGLVTKTSPKSSNGVTLSSLNPICATLGVANASFVALAADWIPDVLYQIIKLAFQHRGFSFIRVLQRCPTYNPTAYDKFIKDPSNLQLLTHPTTVQLSDMLKRIFKNHIDHDPVDLNAARNFCTAEMYPIGVLYQDKNAPVYEDLRRPKRAQTPELIEQALNREFDKFGIAAH